MLVRYVGPLATVTVPSVGSAVVAKEATLECTEVQAKRLLTAPALWVAADAEAEAVTAGFPEAYSSVRGFTGAYNSELVYPTCVEVEEGGMVYSSVVPSQGETPSVAVSYWSPVATVKRAGVEKQLTETPPEATFPNTFLGPASSSSLAAHGEANTTVGHHAGEHLTSGGFNTLVGYGAGVSLTTGGYNTCVGSVAGGSLIAGTRNVCIGEDAAAFLTEGERNVFLGDEAGGELAEASYQLYVQVDASFHAPLIRGDFKEAEIGFLGAEPVKRAAHPTTLADVITILKNLGFCE